MAEKDILTLAEAIDYFRLSRRKFSALLKSEEKYDFIVYYRSRKMIIRVLFQMYLEEHGELRRCRKWEREAK